MFGVRLTCVVAAALWLSPAAGCKKQRSYDMSSPEATLASFEKAIDDGRIPDDLGRLVIDETEQQQWRLRCKTRGCKNASFEVVEAGNRGRYEATVDANFTVEGDLGGVVLSGRGAPISFVRDGNRWFIKRIGTELPVELKTPKDRPIRPRRTDAGQPAAGADAATTGRDGG